MEEIVKLKPGMCPEPKHKITKVNRAEELVNAHWKYIKGVLEISDMDDEIIDKIGFHYRTSGIHFYNHAVEDCENKYEK